ncbi:ABC transporter related protein [Arcobacter nitrofigilis DSM 7299]|uniref:ABC transporter related protein n=1 Tax=Arcobacter nitrofigilis (strain ATCC 33309 / DSM 7299 / CCUG 15893 / LMG 7604 / NCTC 12251 / CI) TaxID=572480 RepID=D5V6C5_ARCNC|nr:ABC transporter ATP-binding protein [Arcobacter nitrofigilis]ADG94195.1 ABC transporter related protein [Arcobacter nitrofigilis DSM 7299]
MYKKLSSLLTKKDRKFLLFLIIFSVLIALIETIGVAAIMPFISVASDFNMIESNNYYKIFYNFFEFKSNVDFVIVFGCLLICFYIIRGGLNILYFYFLAKFSKGRTHLLAFRLFENYLGMNYHQFISRNSSELSKLIINETQNLTAMLSAVLLMISEVFVVMFIYSAMLYINWKITLVMTLFLTLNALFLVKKISPIIKNQGTIREEYQKNFFEILNSTFGNFKIIKLQSNDKLILNRFNNASYGFSKSGIINETLSHFPRVFLETLGFGIIASVVVYLVFRYESDISSSLGVLSMFILGLYRLMPSSNRLLSSYNQILYYHKSLDLIHNDLMYDCEKLGDEKVIFQKIIRLNNLTFGYSEKTKVLENINLDIKKGEKIAFVGASGSGKSTMVDIIIGLFRPLSGDIQIDGIVINESNIKSLRKKVGYIPQSVYLFDGTVAENISFGLEYDELKIKEVLKRSKILNFLEEHQNGINTFVGEGGIKLSGGQKQRIAIARALYQEPEILVLDEATSALDEAIEKEIMDEIYNISKDKTLIIIAHRLSTIDRCEKVYRIENKKLVLQ